MSERQNVTASDMDLQKEVALVNDAKGLAKWFRVSVKIEILGHTIFEWVWPPLKN